MQLGLNGTDAADTFAHGERITSPFQGLADGTDNGDAVEGFDVVADVVPGVVEAVVFTLDDGKLFLVGHRVVNRRQFAEMGKYFLSRGLNLIRKVKFVNDAVDELIKKICL